MWRVGSDGVPFLASSIPDLGLDDFGVDVGSPGLELDSNGGFGIEAELILGKPGQYLRLAHRRVSDHHHLEHIVYLFIDLISNIVVLLHMIMATPATFRAILHLFHFSQFASAAQDSTAVASPNQERG